MKINQILSAKGDFVATIHPDSTVADLIDALAQHNVGALIVSTDGERISGIVSERDVVRALAHGKHGSRLAELDKTTVREIMTVDVRTCTPQSSIEDLMGMMTNGRMRHIPVADADHRIAGIVSIGDVVKHRMAELEDERQALIDYVSH